MITETVAVPDTAEAITDDLLCESRWVSNEPCGRPAEFVIDVTCRCHRRTRYSCNGCRAMTAMGFMRCGLTFAHNVTLLNSWPIRT